MALWRKKMSDYIYILEMTVETIDGMINEPIGAFSTEKNAQKWLKKAQDTFTSKNIVLSVLPVQLDSKPPILEISEEVIDRGVGYQLTELYNKDVFDQMVEEDGTFTYQVKRKYQNSMEKTMSRDFRRKNNDDWPTF